MEENSGDREQSESYATNRNEPEGVVFLGWQKMLSGEKVALYNVTTEHHPLYGSTVTDETLRANHLPVPQPPAAPKREANGR
ncbi:MAG TPA: hypothetical protein VGA55_06470 [Bacteroidota bacterium]